MSALQQFTNQGPPPPAILAPAATSLDQPCPEDLSSSPVAAPPWHAPRLAFTQLLQARDLEQPRQQESLAEQMFSETLNQEIQPEPVSNALEKVYVFEDRREILAFIMESRAIMGSRVIEDLLLEAQEPLNSAFGQESVKKLTLVEDDEGFVTLFCLVLVPGSLDDARRALMSFDESWWLARSGRVGYQLNFDFELI